MVWTSLRPLWCGRPCGHCGVDVPGHCGVEVPGLCGVEVPGLCGVDVPAASVVWTSLATVVWTSLASIRPGGVCGDVYVACKQRNCTSVVSWFGVEICGRYYHSEPQ